MKHLKPNKKELKFTIGDYIKIKDNSTFYYLANNRIFKIYKEDYISVYLLDIYGNYPGTTFFEMGRNHIRKLTNDEKEELEMLLISKKYNI